MRIRVEGDGHCVEIEHQDTNRTPEQLAELAEHVWKSTRGADRPRQTMGFAGQLVERTYDRPVTGNGSYESKPIPVTS